MDDAKSKPSQHIQMEDYKSGAVTPYQVVFTKDTFQSSAHLNLA